MAIIIFHRGVSSLTGIAQFLGIYNSNGVFYVLSWSFGLYGYILSMIEDFCGPVLASDPIDS